MFDNKTEQEARQEILDLVKEYCDTYHNKKGNFKEGDRIPYASRVYDHDEMVNLVDSLRRSLQNTWVFVTVL